MQMLFDPFEQLNLSTFTVLFYNGQRNFNRDVVGQEAIDLASFNVFIHNEPECAGRLLGRVMTGKACGLVGEDSGVFVHRHGLNNFVGNVVLCAGNKLSAFLVEVRMKFFKSYISLVQQVKGAPFDWDFIYDFGVVDFAWRKQNKCRNRAS